MSLSGFVFRGPKNASRRHAAVAQLKPGKGKKREIVESRKRLPLSKIPLRECQRTEEKRTWFLDHNARSDSVLHLGCLNG